jgi:uncharacterized protein YegP (UPF0339 family)
VIDKVDEPKTQRRRRRSMSATDLKFVIFRDLKDGYRWRLSSARGETIKTSARGHRDKEGCKQVVHRLREDRYPGAEVRDASVGSM